MKKNEITTVERDPEGIPSAWRLFKAGINNITEQSGDSILRLPEEDLKIIAERHAQKGVLIPVDAQHFLYHVAKEQHIDEDDLAAADPYRDGVGTLVSCQD